MMRSQVTRAGIVALCITLLSGVAIAQQEAENMDAEAKRLEQIRLQREMQERGNKAVAERMAKMEQESEERYKRSLAAISKLRPLARYNCKDKAHCDKAFAWTQIFISENSTMKIQAANDTVLETYNGTKSSDISMKAIKVPGAGSTADIVLNAACKGESEPEMRYCASKLEVIYLEFPLYMRANVKR